MFRVYFLNDRFGIYALGYPVITWFGHLVNLAELVALTLVLYALLIVGATVFNALALHTPIGGRALLREVRSSFYRKLWLMFVAAAVVPVIVLAIATRAYFVTQLGTGVEEGAVSHRDDRAAPRRGLRDPAAAGRRDARRARRSDHGPCQEGDRPGRGPVRRREPSGDEPARPVRVGTARHAHARARSIDASPWTACRPLSPKRKWAGCGT